MRLFLSAALLLASTAAVPALAQDNPPPHHDGGHPEGGHPNGGRPGTPRPAGAPQGQPHGQPGQQPGGFNHGPQGGQPNAAAPNNGGRPAFPTGPGPVHGGQGGYRGPLPKNGAGAGNPGGTPGGQGAYHSDDRNGVRTWRGGAGGDPRAGGPGGPGNFQHGGPGGPGNPGVGYQHGGPGNPGGGGGNWNRGWRGDQRYDWQAYRDGHRNAYHIGRYQAPYGYEYGYQRFGIGAELDAGFFAEQYWISDPDYYHLPPAYGPYRWVRYYNDALLVNIYNGAIVDEIPDFFW